MLCGHGAPAESVAAPYARRESLRAASTDPLDLILAEPLYALLDELLQALLDLGRRGVHGAVREVHAALGERLGREAEVFGQQVAFQRPRRLRQPLRARRRGRHGLGRPSSGL